MYVTIVVVKKLIANTKHHILPKYLAQNIADIDFTYLKSQGITHCFYDLDHTILYHGANIIDKEVIHNINISGMKTFIATNRRRTDTLTDLAKQINASAIMHSAPGGQSKPRGVYFKQLIKMAKTEPQKIAMVGDRLVQDVWGASRQGINTVMIAKLGSIHWWDQPLTIPDRALPILLSRYYSDVKHR